MFGQKTDELKIWKFLTNLWAILTIIFFSATFFKLFDLTASLANISIIYVSLLSLFVGIKEVSRWRDHQFSSHYHGEIFIWLWTILMIVFITLQAIRPEKYIFNNDFIATYISIVAIFAISRKSKNLKLK